MDIQEFFTYAIVGLAAVFTARTFIRQFTWSGKSCSKCPHSGPEQGASDQWPMHLIQIEEIEKKRGMGE